jgi:hypothetical protein
MKYEELTKMIQNAKKFCELFKDPIIKELAINLIVYNLNKNRLERHKLKRLRRCSNE